MWLKYQLMLLESQTTGTVSLNCAKICFYTFLIFLTLAEPLILIASISAIVISVAMERDVHTAGLPCASALEWNYAHEYPVIVPSETYFQKNNLRITPLPSEWDVPVFFQPLFSAWITQCKLRCFFITWTRLSRTWRCSCTRLSRRGSCQSRRKCGCWGNTQGDRHIRNWEKSDEMTHGERVSFEKRFRSTIWGGFSSEGLIFLKFSLVPNL